MTRLTEVRRPILAPGRIAPEDNEILYRIRALDCVCEDGLFGPGGVEQRGASEVSETLELWMFVIRQSVARRLQEEKSMLPAHPRIALTEPANAKGGEEHDIDE